MKIDTEKTLENVTIPLEILQNKLISHELQLRAARQNCINHFSAPVVDQHPAKIESMKRQNSYIYYPLPIAKANYCDTLRSRLACFTSHYSN